MEPKVDRLARKTILISSRRTRWSDRESCPEQRSSANSSTVITGMHCTATQTATVLKAEEKNAHFNLDLRLKMPITLHLHVL